MTSLAQRGPHANVPRGYVSDGAEDHSMPMLDSVFSMTSTVEVEFQPIRVHVPLPDVLISAPEVLDFGTVAIGTASTLQLCAVNQGEAPARVAAEVVSGSAFELTDPEVVVAPGESATIGVRFRPLGENNVGGELRVFSNDPDMTPLVVGLRGLGD